MAKMFYTIQETAEKLGVGEADIKQLATAGKLQQFRDRDKLMFKRDQVDALAAAKAEDEEETVDTGLSTGAIPLDDTGLSTGEIPLSAGSGSSDQIDLAAEDAELPGAKKAKSEDSRMATGISVFDAGEIDEADPHTQTIVQPVEDEEELALESVGSGSGLLDLTQESDDTSLGAELLDEIYPTGEGSDLKVEHAGSSGAFEPAGAGASFAAGGGSGLGGYGEGGAAAPVYIEAVEDSDPAGDGLGIGMLSVAIIVIGACLFVALSAIQGQPIEMTKKLAGPGGTEDKTILMYAGGAIFAALLFGVIGFFVGKSRKAKAG